MSSLNKALISPAALLKPNNPSILPKQSGGPPVASAATSFLNKFHANIGVKGIMGTKFRNTNQHSKFGR